MAEIRVMILELHATTPRFKKSVNCSKFSIYLQKSKFSLTYFGTSKYVQFLAIVFAYAQSSEYVGLRLLIFAENFYFTNSFLLLTEV